MYYVFINVCSLYCLLECVTYELDMFPMVPSEIVHPLLYGRVFVIGKGWHVKIQECEDGIHYHVVNTMVCV